MQIERVIPITLSRRRPEKMWAVIGALLSRGVPPQDIEVLDAVDAADFEDAYAIFEAAASDSFKGFSKLVATYEDCVAKGYDTSKGHYCCAWSFLRAFRRVIELDKVCLILIDKYFLTQDYWFLQNAIRSLHDLEILQLTHYDSRFEPVPYDHYPRVPWFPSEDVTNGFLIQRGLAGCGDSALIVSPAGAQKIIDWWNARSWWVAIECVLWDVAKEGVKDGCYSVICGEAICIKEYNIQSPIIYSNGCINLEHFTNRTDSERTSH